MNNNKTENVIKRNWCERFNDLITEANERKKELNKKLSELEHKTQECLHFLELEHTNAPTRARVTKILTECRRERRKIKEELSDITAIFGKINNPNKKISITAKRSYTYSAEFISEIYGEGE